MTRRERIVFLLDHLADCCGPGGSGAGPGDSDGTIGFALTSSMADHPSVIELGRCLELLRRMAPAHARDLEAYFGCGWHVERVPKTQQRKGRLVTVMNADGRAVTVDRLVRSLPGSLAAMAKDRETREPRTVARGIDFISGVFRGDVFVPAQLLAA